MLKQFQRIFKHRWFDDQATRKAVPPDMLARLTQRVQASEKRHSGEIRIFVENGLRWSYLRRHASLRQITRERAINVFSKLRVWDTAQNNGVLIYLLMAERAIEIVADRGLRERVDPQTWQAIVLRMSDTFKTGDFETGLTQALEEVSALLVQHFHLAADETNPNELPDEVLLR
jgi:uncharacterized membrane protein